MNVELLESRALQSRFGLDDNAPRFRVYVGIILYPPSISVPRSIGREGIVGIAGVDEAGASGCQQLLHFLDRFADDAVRLTGFDLAHNLDES